MNKEWIQFNRYILEDPCLQPVFKHNVKFGDRSWELKEIKDWICEHMEDRDFYNLMVRLGELASEKQKESSLYFFYLNRFSKELHEMARKVKLVSPLPRMAETILYLMKIYYPIFHIILTNRRDDVQKGFKKIKDWPTFSKEVLVKVNKVALLVK